MKYFSNCKTIDDVKQIYHRLCKELHPDNGGNAADFVAMRAEFAKAFDRLKDIHVNKAGETYHKETTETPEAFASIIDQIIHLEGIKIEIIGSWIWITGNTYAHREIIKAAGFAWSKSKSAWYHTGEAPTGKKWRGRYSMKGLREKWGTQEVETEPQKKIAS